MSTLVKPPAIRRAAFILILSLIYLEACSSPSTQACTQIGCVDQTVIMIKLPFEPPLGYVVELQSKDFTANVICVYERAATEGVVRLANHGL